MTRERQLQLHLSLSDEAFQGKRSLKKTDKSRSDSSDAFSVLKKQNSPGDQGSINSASQPQPKHGVTPNDGESQKQVVSGSTPADGSKGSTPADGSKGSTPADGSKGSTPADGSKGSTPADGSKGSTPADGSKGSTPADGSKGSTPDVILKESSKKDPEGGAEKPIGTRLKKSREAQGLSLDIVHEGTKIPMDALRAIEEGYSVRTLSPFYYKGFLKIYGDFLGVDVAGELKASSKGQSPVNFSEKEPSFFFRDLFAKSFNVVKIQQILSFLLVLGFFFILFKIFVFIFHRPDANQTTEQSISVDVTEPVAVMEPESRPRVVVPPEMMAKPVQAVPAPTVSPSSAQNVPQDADSPVEVSAPTQAQAVKAVVLVVRAKTDSWLRVVVDGEIVFQSTLAMGSVKTWLADEQIDISGRNLEQLEMELNGKMIGALGRRQRGAKAIRINPDGLTVVQ
jgi:cytoskeletal protein RodZ